MKVARTRFLVIFLTLYIPLAGGWWAFLLYDKNNAVFETKKTLLRLQLEENDISEEEAFLASPEYIRLNNKYLRQNRMIISEAVVLMLILMSGIWVVTRGLRREVALARQQRNFLLSITHELKSPIAGIRLVLETFLKRTLTKEQTDKFAGNALKDAERLHQLVDNLLLAAKVENEHEWYKEFVDMKELIASLLQNLQQKYPAIKFEQNLEDELPPVLADKAGLTSVVLNLLENAVKYCGEKKEIHILLQKHRNRILFEVADFGPGISNEDKEKVFEKFYRIGDEDHRKTKGTGLGLFIVREIVKAHNGQIFVKDNIPQGAKFQVWWPGKARNIIGGNRN